MVKAGRPKKKIERHEEEKEAGRVTRGRWV